MSWATERKSWALPVHVSSARNNVFLWLWINCILPGNFLPEEISKSCPPIVIVNGFWFCFNFHGNRKICFLTVFEYKRLISMGSFEYVSLHFYPLKCFEPLSLTPWLHLVLWNLFFLSQNRQVFSHTFFIFQILFDSVCWQQKYSHILYLRVQFFP